MSMVFACQAHDCMNTAIASAWVERDPRYFPHIVSPPALVWVCADHFPNGRSGNPIVDDLRERIEVVGVQRNAAEERAQAAERERDYLKERRQAWRQVGVDAVIWAKEERDKNEAAEQRAERLTAALREAVEEIKALPSSGYIDAVSELKRMVAQCGWEAAIAADTPIETEQPLARCPQCGKGSYTAYPADETGKRQRVCTYCGTDYADTPTPAAEAGQKGQT